VTLPHAEPTPLRAAPPPPGGRFIGRTIVEPMDDWWIVREPFSYVSAQGLRVDVPQGFVTDWASIPRRLWWLLSPTDKRYRRAALIHDVCYEKHQALGPDGATVVHVSRLAADRLLRAAACIEGCEPFWAAAIYQSVRLFGGSAYETGAARQLERRAILGLGPGDP
jgi:hypothetical protein